MYIQTFSFFGCHTYTIHIGLIPQCRKPRFLTQMGKSLCASICQSKCG